MKIHIFKDRNLQINIWKMQLLDGPCLNLWIVVAFWVDCTFWIVGTFLKDYKLL